MSTGPISHRNCWCGGGVDYADDTAICTDSDFHDPHASGRPPVIQRLYVAGPMSNYEHNNYPEFHRVSSLLREAGFTVVNPAEAGVPGKDRVHYVDLLRQDLIDMMTCHGVAVIDHWWESAGARNEVQVAGILKMPVHSYEKWLEIASSGDA